MQQMYLYGAQAPLPADRPFDWHSMFGSGIGIGDVVVLCGLLILVVVLWDLVFAPRWAVWAAHQSGLADLAAAKNEQQIQIAKAQSRLEAADLNKKAAIIEAEAVSAQINAIGAQLKEHDLYLRWQWIKMMEDGNSGAKVIYVPTEANLPILEAMRLAK
jgi:hypothetical protein